MVFFTLVYAERPATSDANRCLNGVFLYNNRGDAVSELYSYVEGRIIDAYVDAFIESADSLGINIFEHMENNDEPASPEEVQNLLSSINSEQKESVINWYFDLANDECCEAFYQLKTHQL